MEKKRWVEEGDLVADNERTLDGSKDAQTGSHKDKGTVGLADRQREGLSCHHEGRQARDDGEEIQKETRRWNSFAGALPLPEISVIGVFAGVSPYWRLCRSFAVSSLPEYHLVLSQC